VTANSSSANMNGKHHRLLERDEAACVAADDVGVCGVFPVVEAEDAMLLGSSAPEEDERKHQESDQEDGLVSANQNSVSP
jgi:hypothetical protein